MERRQLLWRGLGLAAPALGLPRAAHAEPGVTDRELTIGQSIALQGGRNGYGVAIAEAVRAHIDAVNAAGGVNGRQLVLKVLDDENNGGKAEANARKLIAEGAFMLFGSIEGGPSTAIATVAEQTQVPFFGPMAGSPTLRRPHLRMVYPVRAEHRQEFRALIRYGRSVGLRSLAFLHADSDVGRQHLENVRRLADEAAIGQVLPLTLPARPTPADLDRLAQALTAAAPEMMFNHGSAAPYGELIVRARAAGAKTTFMGVNSGSYQLAKSLGALSHGMLFSQVVPSPWERKHEISREYQDAMSRARPGAEFSYGGLEGYLTTKALVAALRAAGRELTRVRLVATLDRLNLDLGGLKLRYSPTEHEGSRFVDLSLVDREGRFIH